MVDWLPTGYIKMLNNKFLVTSAEDAADIMIGKDLRIYIEEHLSIGRSHQDKHYHISQTSLVSGLAEPLLEQSYHHPKSPTRSLKSTSESTTA